MKNGFKLGGSNKISEDSVKKLFKEGFALMEAIQLIDGNDLGRTKILRGQQKLILESCYCHQRLISV